MMTNRASGHRTCTAMMSGSASYDSLRNQLKWLARKSFEG